MRLRSSAPALVLLTLAFPPGLAAQTPPINDLCANAIPIGQGSFSGSTLGAGAEGTSLCDDGLGPDVWYRYDGPIDENGLAIDTLGANINAVVSIHARCPESSPGRGLVQFLHEPLYEQDSSLACSDNGLGRTATLLVPPELPNGFLIRVAGSNPAAQGEFRLQIDQGVTLSGTVVDRATAEPITSGEVVVRSVSRVQYHHSFRQEEWTAPLDENGHFEVRGAPPGQLKLAVRGIAPFISQVYSDRPGPEYRYLECRTDEGDTLSVGAGGHINGLIFEVDRGGTIRGRVTDQLTGEPVANARIEARYDFLPYQRLSSTSGANGTYELTGLIDAEFHLSVSAPTHRSTVYPNQPCGHGPCQDADFAEAPKLQIRAAESLSDIHFTIDARGGFAGQITDAADRSPVLDAVVEVYDEYALLRQAPVDAQGRYQVGGLDPSPQAYRVLVRSQTHRSELLGGHECVYPRNPFCDPSESNPLFLQDGEITPDLDFRLDRLPVISGRITEDKTGNPLAGIEVEFNSPYHQRIVQTDEDGRYRLVGAVPGVHWARTRNASPFVDELFGGIPCQDVLCLPTDGTPIEVDFGQDATAIDFQLDRGGLVSGTVRDAQSGQPIPFARIVFSDATSRGFQARATTNRLGRYEIVLPTGSSIAYTESVFFGHIESYFNKIYDGVSCGSHCDIREAGTPIPVTGGQRTSGIDFDLDRPSGISGFVTTGEGAPIPGVPMRLYTASGSYIGAAETDHRGFYTFTSVVPGTYKVVAGDSAMQGRSGVLWPDTPCPNDPALRCDLESGGRPITVEGSGQFTRGIDFAGLRTGAIVGTVTDQATGLPLAGVGIDIWRNMAGFHWFAGSTVTDADGTYRIDADAGQYDISTDLGTTYGINEVYNDISCSIGSVRLGTCDLSDGNTVSFGFDGPAEVDFELAVSHFCVPDSRTLCLGEDGRFRIQAEWERLAQGTYLTRDSGVFWFFDFNNIELVVKVLDACTLESNRFWFFATGLTDIATTLTVQDTWTGDIQTYSTEAGQPFPPILDTGAFETCDAAPAGQRFVDELPHFEPKTSSCDGDLCLNESRFKVEAFWNAPDGTGGKATDFQLTDSTGFFWFFNSDNIEVVVKVLDGCNEPQNTYWVFAAGLTNVEVRLRVTDRETGAVREYFNPQGTPFQPILDTQAFATCP